MITAEAIIKMQNAVSEAMKKLDGNGFDLSVETEYLNRTLQGVEDISKAKYVTVSLVVASKDSKEGEEYCMSLGAMITRRGIDDSELEKNIDGFGKMVDEALAMLEKYDNKDEGLAYLTEKASEEYKKLVEKMEEEQKKNRKLSMISNIVFILGIALLFIVAVLR